MNKSVFHIRLKDFELQVERMLDSGLRTRAVAVISSHQQNGTIVALSPEAVQEGIQKGMNVSLVRKMSHSVALLPYNSTLYARMHRYIYRTVSNYSPVIEPTVYGQYFIDMTGMDRIYKDDLQAGSLISRDISGKVNLASQIGISINKLVSSISTAVVPENIYRVSNGSEPNFLAPLQSEILPTSRERQVERMIKFLFLYRVQNVQEVVACADSAEILFGKHSKKLAMEARGEDHSVVQPPQLQDHVIEQTTLTIDTNDEDILRAVVRDLAEQTAYQLRRRRQVAKSIALEVHYTDGFKNTRKGALPANDDDTVIREADDLFTKANYRRNRIRAIVIDATQLKPVVDQLDLFDRKKNDDLSKSLDRIRRKYGFEGIMAASGLAIPRTKGDGQGENPRFPWEAGAEKSQLVSSC